MKYGPPTVHLVWLDTGFDGNVPTSRNGASLKEWGDDNKTTFEPEKMSAMAISQKRVPFDAPGIFAIRPITAVLTVFHEEFLITYIELPKIKLHKMARTR